jgi:hypothetical protein
MTDREILDRFEAFMVQRAEQYSATGDEDQWVVADVFLEHLRELREIAAETYVARHAQADDE